MGSEAYENFENLSKIVKLMPALVHMRIISHGLGLFLTVQTGCLLNGLNTTLIADEDLFMSSLLLHLKRARCGGAYYKGPQ